MPQGVVADRRHDGKRVHGTPRRDDGVLFYAGMERMHPRPPEHEDDGRPMDAEEHAAFASALDALPKAPAREAPPSVVALQDERRAFLEGVARELGISL